MEIAELIQTDFLNAESNLLKEVDFILNNELNENQIESINILRKNGFVSFKQSSDLFKNERLKKEKKEINEFKKFFNGYKCISQSTLDFILEKYDLIINEPKKFTSQIPLEASKYILDCNNKIKQSNMCFDYYIVAPKEMFNAKLEVNLDPIILANRRNSSFYTIVYAWGVEKNILNSEEI